MLQMMVRFSQGVQLMERKWLSTLKQLAIPKMIVPQMKRLSRRLGFVSLYGILNRQLHRGAKK